MYPDVDGELRLLTEAGFIDLDEPSEEGGSYYVRIFVPSKSSYFFYEFVEYIEEVKVGYNNPVVI